jgi:WD40 repeat protein
VRWLTKDTAIFSDGSFALKYYDWKHSNTTTAVANAHTNNVRFIELLDSTHYVTASDDSTIKVWNNMSWSNVTLVFNLTGHTGAVYCLKLLTAMSSVANASSLIASGSADSTVKVWNWQTGALLYTLFGHSAQVTQLEVVSSSWLASASYDFTIKVFFFCSFYYLAIAVLASQLAK